MKNFDIASKIYRVLCFVTLICVSSVLSAEVVNKATAEAVAKRYMVSAKINLVWSGGDLRGKSASGEAPAFYLFNDQERDQWVIVSGESCTIPILAHGSGRIDLDNLPENMKAYLSVVSDNIFKVREYKVQQSGQMKDAWDGVDGRLRSAGSEKLLETAKWGQSSPYNLMCPMASGGSRTITGCVATSMAIFMRYCEFPAKGKGTIPGYTSNSISVQAFDISNHTYNYDDMPLSNYSSWSNDEKNEVAALMAHCGAAVQMEYGTSSSSAFSDDIVEAMSTYFSYSALAIEKYRYNYSDKEWLDMIKAEIDADYPIIYGGYHPGSGGHQFICDGYNSNNEIHINWGWNGSSNGWYAVCYLGTNYDGIYSRNDSAIFGLRPAVQEYSVASELAFVKGQGLTLGSGVSGKLVKGETFSLSIGQIKNLNYDFSYSGKVKVALVGKSGALKEFISDEVTCNIGARSTKTLGTVSCKITQDFVLGDYICLYYKQPDQSWLPVGGERSFYDGKYSLNRVNVFDIDMIEEPESLNVGQLYYPSILFGYKLPSKVVWYYDGSTFAEYKEYVKLTAGKHTLKAVITYPNSGGTKTVVKTIVVK